MTTLLIVTIGQSDVQLVDRDVRREFEKKCIAKMHDEIELRRYELCDSPMKKESPIGKLPVGPLSLCTPKLDAVLQHDKLRTELSAVAALLLETRRKLPTEPRLAGTLLKERLMDRGVASVSLEAYLRDREYLEDRGEPRDAIIRREVADRLEVAVRDAVLHYKPTRIVVSATGGFPVVTNLVEKIVSLYVLGTPTATIVRLEVADGALEKPPAVDRAVECTSASEPTLSFQARRQVIELVEKGNLLGAWAVAQPLDEDKTERYWTQVIHWLALFASSLPMEEDCDIPVLTHRNMAVRNALRVEFALRAGDIPRAVHGTVAFFEAALWDNLYKHVERSSDPGRRKFYRFKTGAAPLEHKLRRTGRPDCRNDRKRPFECKETIDGIDWYWIYDDRACSGNLVKYFLKSDALKNYNKALGTQDQNSRSYSGDIRDLRNDVAHEEPTPELMRDAAILMRKAKLWSESGSFLRQPLVQFVFEELDVSGSGELLEKLLTEMRERLIQHGSTLGAQ